MKTIRYFNSKAPAKDLRGLIAIAIKMDPPYPSSTWPDSEEGVFREHALALQGCLLQIGEATRRYAEMPGFAMREIQNALERLSVLTQEVTQRGADLGLCEIEE
jgi:hypothetical protein